MLVVVGVAEAKIVAAAEMVGEAISQTKTRPLRPLQVLQIQTKIIRRVKSLIKEVKNILTYLPKQTGPVLSIGARAANLRIVLIL